MFVKDAIAGQEREAAPYVPPSGDTVLEITPSRPLHLPYASSALAENYKNPPNDARLCRLWLFPVGASDHLWLTSPTWDASGIQSTLEGVLGGKYKVVAQKANTNGSSNSPLLAFGGGTAVPAQQKTWKFYHSGAYNLDQVAASTPTFKYTFTNLCALAKIKFHPGTCYYGDGNNAAFNDYSLREAYCDTCKVKLTVAGKIICNLTATAGRNKTCVIDLSAATPVAYTEGLES